LLSVMISTSCTRDPNQICSILSQIITQHPGPSDDQTSPCPAPLPDSALIASYPLYGTATDVGPNKLKGTIINAIAVAGLCDSQNSAYQFTKGSYISVPDNDLLDGMSSLTIETWVKGKAPAASTGVNQCIVGKGWDYDETSGAKSYNLHWDHWWAGLHFNLVTDAGEVVLSSIGEPDTAWHYLVATYDGSAMRLFIDGVLDSQKPQHGTVIRTNSDFEIGRLSNYHPDCFEGIVDIVNIYSRALSAEEIADRYSDTQRWCDSK